MTWLRPNEVSSEDDTREQSMNGAERRSEDLADQAGCQDARQASHTSIAGCVFLGLDFLCMLSYLGA